MSDIEKLPVCLVALGHTPSEFDARLIAGLAAVFTPIAIVPTRAEQPGPLAGIETIAGKDLRKALQGRPVAAVIFTRSAPPGLRRRVWWWKRRRQPNALLGGFWSAPGDDSGKRERWMKSMVAAAMDFFLAADQKEMHHLRQTGVPAGCVMELREGVTRPEEIAAFVQSRVMAERRSVLWVDEDISLDSPSAKHLVYSLPDLQRKGWSVRAWCLTADAAAHADAEVRELAPVPNRLRMFTPYWFFAVANLYGLTRTLLKGRAPARVVHTVGGAFLGADLVMIQFVNHVWLRKQWELGNRNLKGLLLFLWTIPAVLKDQLQFSNPRCRLFLPASDSIADEVHRRCLPRAEVRTLANSYDETRFNPATRARWREPMREELGFLRGDIVFCFASQGHYQRKGFWLAVEALALLRRGASATLPRRTVKFLVIGGQPKTLERLKIELGDRYSDWASWLVFVGNQAVIEKYFAAADAFLFPSYFEAFCLAEIEAGAMGLPLLLTPHHGIEMILEDGVNGLRLSFDPTEICEKLAVFLKDGLLPFPATPGRALRRKEYALALARIYEQATAESADKEVTLERRIVSTPLDTLARKTT